MTRVMYVAFGALALLGSAIVLMLPSVVVPPDQPGVVRHLFQEQAAAFVFVGLMCLWCARHPVERRPVHASLFVFLSIYAGVHWWGVARGDGHLLGALATTIPVVLLALTWPSRAVAISHS